MDDLAACLRTWRDRLDPAQAGLPDGPRRTPGLRREEVALLAGLSVDYLARLEQGRATHPSVSVLEPLARALRLSDDERAHLFRLAGHGGPTGGTLRRHITPSVQRVMDRLRDVPTFAVDAGWDVLAVNPLADALLGPQPTTGRHHGNVAWRHFMGSEGWVAHTPEQEASFGASVVADLHHAQGLHPDDARLAQLVTDLRAASREFARLWDERPVAPQLTSHKLVRHPQVGDVEVDCDVLTVAGSDVRLIVYSAAAGSESESKLALLGAIGRQSFQTTGDSGPGVR